MFAPIPMTHAPTKEISFPGTMEQKQKQAKHGGFQKKFWGPCCERFLFKESIVRVHITWSAKAAWGFTTDVNFVDLQGEWPSRLPGCSKLCCKLFVCTCLGEVNVCIYECRHIEWQWEWRWRFSMLWGRCFHSTSCWSAGEYNTYQLNWGWQAFHCGSYQVLGICGASVSSLSCWAQWVWSHLQRERYLHLFILFSNSPRCPSAHFL